MLVARAHGTSGGSFVTYERVTEETKEKYNAYIGVSYTQPEDVDYFCWTFNSTFIEKNYEENKFPYSLIYAEACYGLKYEHMAEAFVKCGAATYVSYQDWLSLHWSGDSNAQQFFNDMCIKGYTVENAVDDLHTWYDPFCSLAWYGDKNLRLNFEGEETNSLGMALHSPAEMYLTDTKGRHIGFDPYTRQVVNEIPDAIFCGGPNCPEEEVRFIWIPEVEEEICDIKIIGTSSGDFTLSIGMSNITSTTIKTYTGRIKPDQILNCTVTTTKSKINIVENFSRSHSINRPWTSWLIMFAIIAASVLLILWWRSK
jgi:hypothetical protein